METSLAPSPMARVTAFLARLISSTTSAFCRGVTRQQITALHCEAMSRNLQRYDNEYFSLFPSLFLFSTHLVSSSGDRQWTSECPLTTRANPFVSSTTIEGALRRPSSLLESPKRSLHSALHVCVWEWARELVSKRIKRAVCVVVSVCL